MLRALTLACAVASISTSATAGLLGLVPNLPLTSYNNQGMTTFDASSGVLTIDASPIAVRFSATTPPRVVVADDVGERFLFLQVRLAPDGSYVGGVPGDDFIVVGAVDQDGDGSADFSGVLLAGEVAAFGFAPPVGTTGQFDLRLYPTSGEMIDFFDMSDAALLLTSEMSTFTGSFESSWSGEAKGTYGPIPTNRIGACCLPSGECVQSSMGECLAQNGTYNGDGVACTDLDTFTFVKDYTNKTQSAAAGRTTIVRSTFNATTKRLTWEATFRAENGVLPNGFTLAVNDGPNPNGLPGQLALFYFDCSGTGPIADPVLTVYGYNGQNNPNSFKDGDGNSANDPNPDVILSSLTDAGWVNALTCRNNDDGTRTIGFDINVIDICEHVPAFPNSMGEPWTGAQFDESFGFWFHPFRLTDVNYNDMGFLTLWNFDRQGWVDVANEVTTTSRCVPTVGACCLPSGECRAVSAEECAALNGTFAGINVTCEELDTFIFSKDYTNNNQNSCAGKVTRVYSTFNPSTKRLYWETTFKPSNGVLPDSFTQVINDGPNPNGLPGQLAIFYFDSDTQPPVLTVYAYNGRNNFYSYKDGDGNSANDPNGDKILSSRADDSFVYSLIARDNPDGSRTLGFDIDATAICAHMPRFPSAGNPWTGVGFDTNIGFWLHPFDLYDATYDANGCLTRWNPYKEGWLDVSNEHATSERCPRVPTLLVHYDFSEQSGNIVYDKAGNLDLLIVEEQGKIDWVVGQHKGTGVKFIQNSSGKARIQTASPAQTDALRNRLKETDAVTVQILCKQSAGASEYARILSWSSDTPVSSRNFSIIGRQRTVNGKKIIDNLTRIKTDSGTTDSGPQQPWKTGQAVVITFTYDGVNDDTLRVYRNGTEIFRNFSPSGGFDAWSQFDLLLGNEKTLNRAFKGTIYDVKIWDSALRPEEVAAESATAALDAAP